MTAGLFDAEAIVLGGGVGGLNAAYQLAKRGVIPLLIEARSRVGGLVFGRKVGDVWIDLGAEAYAKRSRYTTALCHELGLPTLDPASSSWIYYPERGLALPIPHGVLGIPSSLDDPAVARALSDAGLARAREDLTMGPDAGADAENLASLVGTRLGPEALAVLVAPIAGGIHSAPPELLSVDIVAPGLRAGLRQHGSLTAASAALRAAAPSGAVVSAVEGGMFRLVEALETAIGELGGNVVTEQMATSIVPVAGGWQVTVERRRRPTNPWDPGVPDGHAMTLVTPRLVVALDGRDALDLLRPLPAARIGDWQLPRGADLVQVSLAIDDSRLDAAPRGSGCLVAPSASGLVTAKALTHYSAKWPWTRTISPQHLLRVSYGRAGVLTPEPTLGDVLHDASTLLGIELDSRTVRGTTTIHFSDSLPPHTPEHRERVAQLADAALPGLAVTGAWVAGSGLSGTLPHAEASADWLAS